MFVCVCVGWRWGLAYSCGEAHIYEYNVSSVISHFLPISPHSHAHTHIAQKISYNVRVRIRLLVYKKCGCELLIPLLLVCLLCYSYDDAQLFGNVIPPSDIHTACHDSCSCCRYSGSRTSSVMDASHAALAVHANIHIWMDPSFVTQELSNSSHRHNRFLYGVWSVWLRTQEYIIWRPPSA